MYHLRFNGTHYQIGHRWGQLLKQRGIQILQTVPFPITKHRQDFADACVPVYAKHFPQVLEEIQGIAEGQACKCRDLQAVLFGMYCIMPAAHCSCFVTKAKDGGVILGRNSDFLTSIEKLYMNTIYQFLDDTYSFNGNTTAFVEMEDGINQHGLAVGLTSVAPLTIQPGINAGMLLRLFLEKCKTVGDVLLMLKSIPVASSQTFVVADAFGDAALLECTPDKIEVEYITEETPFACATNMFNTPKMQQYNNLPQDTWQAGERYATMQAYLRQNTKAITVQKAQSLLAGQQGFICQYNRKTGKDTVWSALYSLPQKTVYRAEGNPGRKAFKQDCRAFLKEIPQM